MKNVARQAINLSRERLKNHPEFLENGFLHFSFIIYKGKIISVGVNHRGIPDRKFGYPKISKIHAEIDAYNKAKGLLRGDEFILINIRLNKKGELRDSMPCENCLRLMRKFGCKKILFSSTQGEKLCQ